MKIRAICLALCTATAAHALSISEETPRAYDCPACEGLSHDPLSAHWILKNNSSENMPSNMMSSRQYSFFVTGAELKSGLPIMLDASKPVIRITPIHHALPINSAFNLKTPQGHIIALDNAITPLADSSALNPAGGFMTQLSPNLGTGQFILKNQSAAIKNNDQFQVTVLNHSDNAYISIETDSPMYVFGKNIHVTVTSSGKIAGNPVINVDAEIVNPAGESYPLILSRIDTTTYQASAALLNEINSLGQNWSVFAEATAMDKNGKILKSKIRTSFSYAIPSGIINSISQDVNDPMTYHLNLNIATGSRYAINAVLVSQDENQRQIPLEMVQTADWFTPGEHQISVTFSSEELKQYKNVGIGLLEVIDYGQVRKVFEYRS